MQTRDVIALAIVIMLFSGFWTAIDIKQDMGEVRSDVGDLREGMARMEEKMTKVETLLEQLLEKEGLAINND